MSYCYGKVNKRHLNPCPYTLSKQVSSCQNHYGAWISSTGHLSMMLFYILTKKKKKSYFYPPQHHSGFLHPIFFYEGVYLLAY